KAPEQPAGPKPYTGKVVDAVTKAPIEGAPVTLGDKMVRTNKEGVFSIEGAGEKLRLRAVGYNRRDLPLTELGDANKEITLQPLKVTGLYLSTYGAASPKIRGAALEVLERNNMNALVIDVKGDRGFVPFKVDIPLAEQVGAQKIILNKDYPAFIKSLKEKNLYLIARIVVFKDDLLAGAKPEWTVKTKGGGTFRDRERLRWTDPFRKEVWDYNIAIAKVAAEMGFDEIQFDYVRCPDNRGVSFSQPSTRDSRTKAITGFLEAAYEALKPYNVFVAADVFGYVPWNEGDIDIGQQIVPLTKAVDYVSLMVYPSGYHLGIPKYRNPVKNPYEIVYQTHTKAVERTKASPLQFRPWLQAFRDYAFGAGEFTEERMRIQIKASDDFGASGFMFWNAGNKYPAGVFYSGNGNKKKSQPEAAGLKPAPASGETKESPPASQEGKAPPAEQTSK
ncbi:MAG: putative glycoside hydrolase, partial [Desulfobaccales bacterium]